MTRYSLGDKVVFITGVGRGLGGHRHDADGGVVLVLRAWGDSEAALHLLGVHPQLTAQVLDRRTARNATIQGIVRDADVTPEFDLGHLRSGTDTHLDLPSSR